MCGLLAGVVVAAAVLPDLALVGLTAKAGADTFENMPTNFEVLPSPQMTNISFSDGHTLMASVYDENRRDVPLSTVAPVMQQAIVAVEDKNFSRHHGVDLKGVLRAFARNEGTGDKQGASTLTMQYIRQVLQYSAKTPEQVVEATEQTPARKIWEMRYAIVLANMLSMGYITRAQHDAAVQVDPKITDRRPPQGCTEVRRADIDCRRWRPPFAHPGVRIYRNR